MKRVILLLMLSCAPAVVAAPAPKPPACVSPSAEYVPGVDVHGRAVAPADLNGQLAPDLGTVTIVPRVTVPDNPVMKDAQVVVDLKKLPQTPQNCPPSPPAPRR